MIRIHITVCSSPKYVRPSPNQFANMLRTSWDIFEWFLNIFALIKTGLWLLRSSVTPSPLDWYKTNKQTFLTQSSFNRTMVLLQRCCWFNADTPAASVLQLIFQPGAVLLPSLLNLMSTRLVLLTTVAGREEPLVFPIRVVPSPSVIVR